MVKEAEDPKRQQLRASNVMIPPRKMFSNNFLYFANMLGSNNGASFYNNITCRAEDNIFGCCYAHLLL